jgi:hypothetical protein
MLNCLYMSFWSTNYLALVNHYSQHVAAYQILMYVSVDKYSEEWV